MAGKISENRHFRGPHSHLKPPRQRIPPNIRISLILLETAILGYIFSADNMDLSSFKFLWWAPKDMCVMQQSLTSVRGRSSFSALLTPEWPCKPLKHASWQKKMIFAQVIQIMYRMQIGVIFHFSGVFKRERRSLVRTTRLG